MHDFAAYERGWLPQQFARCVGKQPPERSRQTKFRTSLSSLPISTPAATPVFRDKFDASRGGALEATQRVWLSAFDSIARLLLSQGEAQAQCHEIHGQEALEGANGGARVCS